MASRSNSFSRLQNAASATLFYDSRRTDMDDLSLEPDINILLLGPTGVGKTTFINAIANYIVYNSLASALKGEMITLISASFYVTNSNTNQYTKVMIGTSNSNEHHDDTGQSNTQSCQSYKFTFGNRNLRLIDAPGVGDTRGVSQDAKNLEYILAYINQYKYLNGICVLLKPNEERLNSFFRFCIKELLTHLHVSAKENIMFVFTNSRSTFYMPGATSPLLRGLLSELRRTTHVDVPFSNENTFCLDNEAFRFLATYKHGMTFTPQHIKTYAESWDVSANEFIRLLSHIVNCKPHDVQDTVSINTAQQLIRKLTRPISEVARLIAENISLAEQYEKQFRNSSSYERERMKAMPQKGARFVPLQQPCTVCTSDRCTRVIMVDGQAKVEYTTVCHQNCRLRKVEQEVINNPALFYCRAIDRTKECCKKCGCRYEKHMHITYRYEEYTFHINMNNNYRAQQETSISTRTWVSYETWLSAIHNRINDLQEEQQSMMKIATKLSYYLHTNALSPYNDDLIAYLELFIHEEQLKRAADNGNQPVVDGLTHLSNRYKEEIDFLKNNKPSSALNGKIRTKSIESTTEEVRNVFELIKKLYALPINGSLIRTQVEGLKNGQNDKIGDHEITVNVPLSGRICSIVKELDSIFSPTLNTFF